MEEALFLYEEPEETPEAERHPKPQVTLIPFRLADEWYGAVIEQVIEVLNPPPITKVPNLPDFIRGVTNIRGTITSVTDLKKLLGLGEGRETPETRLMVIRAVRKTTGLLIDSVAKALALPLGSIQPALSTIPKIKAEYIRGEVKLPDGRVLTLLDFEKIMSSDEMRFE